MGAASAGQVSMIVLDTFSGAISPDARLDRERRACAISVDSDGRTRLYPAPFLSRSALCVVRASTAAENPRDMN
jgi:hypothetical protein